MLLKKTNDWIFCLFYKPLKKVLFIFVCLQEFTSVYVNMYDDVNML